MEGSKRRKSKPSSTLSQVETGLPVEAIREVAAKAGPLPPLDDEAKKTLIEILRILDAIDRRAKGIRT